MQGGEDLGFWRWVISGIVSAIIGAWAAAWSLSGKISKATSRLDALEERSRAQVTACAEQRSKMMAELQREIRNSVKLALKDMIIDHNKELAGIVTSIAVQERALMEIQGDIKAIFNRLERRNGGIIDG